FKNVLLRRMYEFEGRIGKHQLFQEYLRVGYLKGVSSGYPDPYAAHFWIDLNDGVRRAPPQMGPLPCRDKVNIGVERRIEHILPAHHRFEDRHVMDSEPGRPRLINIGEPSFTP